MMGQTDLDSKQKKYFEILSVHHLLGDGQAIDQQYWVADMEAALEAAKHVSRDSPQALRKWYCTGARPQLEDVRVGIEVDNEWSIIW